MAECDDLNQLLDIGEKWVQEATDCELTGTTILRRDQTLADRIRLLVSLRRIKSDRSVS